MNITAIAVLQNGKYILNKILNESAFSVTYLATYTHLSQPVVIKTLHPAAVSAVQRQFVESWKAIAACRHPHIVRVLDVFTESNLCYAVMNYVSGSNLANLVESGKILSEAEAVYYIRQISKGVGIIHQQGLLHQNIKPENILLRQGSDCVVLIDFGINSDPNSKIFPLRVDEYAPEEQYLTTEKLTPAADIYSLAATLYYLLTGYPPIPPTHRVKQPSGAEIPVFVANLREIQSNLSPAVEQALVLGLAPAAKDRPQTIEKWLTFLPIKHQPPVVPQNIDVNPGNNFRTPSLPVLQPPPRPPIRKPLPPPEAMPLDTVSLIAKRRKKVKKIKKKPVNVDFRRSPLQTLLIISIIAAGLGIGFGLSIRLKSPSEPGSSVLHRQQSFPPRQDWPVSEPASSEINNNEDNLNKNQDQTLTTQKPTSTNSNPEVINKPTPPKPKIRKRKVKPKAVINQKLTNNPKRPKVKNLKAKKSKSKPVVVSKGKQR